MQRGPQKGKGEEEKKEKTHWQIRGGLAYGSQVPEVGCDQPAQKVAAQLDPHSLLFQRFRLTTTAPEGPATPSRPPDGPASLHIAVPLDIQRLRRLISIGGGLLVRSLPICPFSQLSYFD